MDKRPEDQPNIADQICHIFSPKRPSGNPGLKVAKKLFQPAFGLRQNQKADQNKQQWLLNGYSMSWPGHTSKIDLLFACII